MSVSLCSQFASSLACSGRDVSFSGSSFLRPSSPLLAAAPFARRDGYYGRTSDNADRRLIIARGAKWKRSENPTPIRKPASVEKPSVEKPSGEKPSVEKPSGVKPSGGRPSGGRPSGGRPSGGRPSGVKPSGGRPSFVKPSGGRPSGGRPSVVKPSDEKPSEIPPRVPVVVDYQPIWEEFGRSVSGEWDGYSAELNMFGEPLELPSALVPTAFLEWEQTIRDWQIMCPTIAHPEQGHLFYKIMRFLPTVGCEADAATVYSVENGDFQKTASALAYHKNGSYTAVWRGKRVTNEKQGPGQGKEVTREGDEIEVEQCLVHGKTRIRFLQKLGRRRHILIYREAWEGPFRNGESLGGCAGVVQAFASEKPMLTNSLFGKWKSDIYLLNDQQTEQGYMSSPLVSSGSEVLEKTFASTFFYLGLPKDAWTVLLKTDSGETTIETGWVVQPDLMLVTKCEIGSAGELKDVSLRIEERISSKVAPVKASPEELEDLLTE